METITLVLILIKLPVLASETMQFLQDSPNYRTHNMDTREGITHVKDDGQMIAPYSHNTNNIRPLNTYGQSVIEHGHTKTNHKYKDAAYHITPDPAISKPQLRI